MYHGEVSVPQAELLSLISAAKSLGIRGLAEETALDVVSDDSDRISDRTVYLKDVRGVKRDGELLESQSFLHKKTKKSIPKLQQKIGPKLQQGNEAFKSSDQPKENEPMSDVVGAHENEEISIQRKSDEARTVDQAKVAKENNHKSKEKEETGDQEYVVENTKSCTNLFEVIVKHEEASDFEETTEQKEVIWK